MMANYKAVNKNDLTIVTYKQKESLQVNQREMELFDSNSLSGFMKPRWDTSNEMSFIAPCAIPLKKYLSRNGSMSKACNVLKRTISVINQASDNRMFIQNILLDIKYVFVREKTEEVFFIYEPYIKDTAPAYVNAFFLEVLSCTKIKDKNQQTQLDDLKTFLHTHSRLDELALYIEEIESSRCLQPSYIQTKSPATSMPPTTQPMQTTPILHRSIHSESGETELLTVDDGGTTVLSTQKEPETTLLRRDPIASLTRIQSGDMTQLKGKSCAIGRAEDNFVVISDVSDVSRHHAVIEIKNSICTLTDLGSTNGTTVNGKMIENNVRTKIQNGDVLAFAEVEFSFCIRE